MSDATTITFKAAVEKHGNQLYDAVALLDAAAERIEAATPTTDVDKELSSTMHNTLRLVQMAMDRVQAAADDMFSATDIPKGAHHG